ncbi:transposase [Paraburkholderia caffeinilytica]|uniref:transposase n=1 Tax=Paraburkholderia caffeinilytica TaxID=1761016 RepID=UPI003DA07BE9
MTPAISSRICSTFAVQAVIPDRANRRIQRSLDKQLHRSRNLIERFFCRIMQLRGIATRCDKLAQRFSSFSALAVAAVWLV